MPAIDALEERRAPAVKTERVGGHQHPSDQQPSIEERLIGDAHADQSK